MIKINSPLYKYMEAATNFILISIFTLIFSMGIVTVGNAVETGVRLVRRGMKGERINVLFEYPKMFFRDFFNKLVETIFFLVILLLLSYNPMIISSNFVISFIHKLVIYHIIAVWINTFFMKEKGEINKWSINTFMISFKNLNKRIIILFYVYFALFLLTKLLIFNFVLCILVGPGVFIYTVTFLEIKMNNN